MRRWERRAEALGDGVRSEITPQNAIEVAKTAVPRADGEVLPGEPNGLEVGMQVGVHAQDYGKDPITGTIAAASDQRKEERRVGNECDRTCRSRWSPLHTKTECIRKTNIC